MPISKVCLMRKIRGICMTKQSRYGFSDLVVDENVKLPKYAKIVDDEGNEHEIECYYIEDEEE